jgi:hypothetical protein
VRFYLLQFLGVLDKGEDIVDNLDQVADAIVPIYLVKYTLKKGEIIRCVSYTRVVEKHTFGMMESILQAIFAYGCT